MEKEEGKDFLQLYQQNLDLLEILKIHGNYTKLYVNLFKFSVLGKKNNCRKRRLNSTSKPERGFSIYRYIRCILSFIEPIISLFS